MKLNKPIFKSISLLLAMFLLSPGIAFSYTSCADNSGCCAKETGNHPCDCSTSHSNHSNRSEVVKLSHKGHHFDPLQQITNLIIDCPVDIGPVTCHMSSDLAGSLPLGPAPSFKFAWESSSGSQLFISPVELSSESGFLRTYPKHCTLLIKESQPLYLRNLSILC